MKKPFFWVKSAICKLSNEICDEFSNIPLGIKNYSPNCSNCSIYKEWTIELQKREMTKEVEE